MKICQRARTSSASDSKSINIDFDNKVNVVSLYTYLKRNVYILMACRQISNYYDRGCINDNMSIILHTGIGLTLMQSVWWKFMSKADELLEKLNVEVAL